MAPTIFENVAGNVALEGVGELFAGKTFFVAQRVPIRNRFLDDIRANGGEIVKVEKKADYIIADHLRRDCPPGSISYEFIDKSIKHGELQDPEAHRCGPRLGEVREPGAISRPAKGGRTAYTAEDDRILYKWVRDCKAAGGSDKGNVIYQQLEAKYPHHTWQSWRDRYVKQLLNRPPSAFNIPDNAPPSPPSDTPTEPVQSMPPPSKRSKQQASAANTSKSRSVETKKQYSLDDLAALFSPDDWEELYAFADMIEDMAGEERYHDAWRGWAENQGDQTAEQWRQYYEKVVRPQWLRDPAWKRKQIKEKREKNYDDDEASESESSGQQQIDELEEAEDAADVMVAIKTENALVVSKQLQTVDALFEKLLERKRNDPTTSPYTFYARDQKADTLNANPGLDYVQLHTLLLSRWELLSAEDKKPYIAKSDQLKKHNANKDARLAADLKMLSSSTAQPEPAEHIIKSATKIIKRLRSDDMSDESDNIEEQAEPSRPTKRQKSASPTPALDDRASSQMQLPKPDEQPIEISSTESTPTALTDVFDEQSQEQIRQELLQTHHTRDSASDHDMDHPTASIETDNYPNISSLSPPPKGFDQASDDDLPSNTPTPRAARQRGGKFNTQAILSSPSQDILGRILRRSVSPAQHPESDASTTQSLEEFRRSLNDEDGTQIPLSQDLTRLRPMSLSPSPSTSSSVGSGDPDVPLEIDEIGDFFDEQLAIGFTNNVIAAALRRTRLRPSLTMRVLDAWKDGKKLPIERGIWSKEDDEDVESGDGVALARLERRHTVDGWGGITERLIFLEAHRSR